MATFNMQGQTVSTQYNAETINFNQAESSDDFFRGLKQLQAELEKAVEAKVITGENALDAQNLVSKAMLQGDEQVPSKNTLIEYLTSAKNLVSNVEGLATAFAGAIATVSALFS